MRSIRGVCGQLVEVSLVLGLLLIFIAAGPAGAFEPVSDQEAGLAASVIMAGEPSKNLTLSGTGALIGEVILCYDLHGQPTAYLYPVFDGSGRRVGRLAISANRDFKPLLRRAVGTSEDPALWPPERAPAALEALIEAGSVSAQPFETRLIYLSGGIYLLAVQDQEGDPWVYTALPGRPGFSIEKIWDYQDWRDQRAEEIRDKAAVAWQAVLAKTTKTDSDLWPSDTQISSGISVTGSVAAGEIDYYYISVSSGATELAVTINNVTGDPDLYTRHDAQPTTSNYDCRPYYGTGRSETCTHSNPTAGVWYIMVRGYSAGTYTLAATVTGGHQSQENSISGVPNYFWYRGCTTVAAGMLLHYWGGNGYPDIPHDTDLFTWSYPDDSRYSTYTCTNRLMMVDRELCDALADETGVAPECRSYWQDLWWYDGWGANGEGVKSAIEAVTAAYGYDFGVQIETYQNATSLRLAIDAGRPVFVGTPTHAVCGYGYSYDSFGNHVMVKNANTYAAAVEELMEIDNEVSLFIFVTPSSGDDDDETTTLSNNQPVSVSVARGEEARYRISVPSSDSQIEVRITDVSGDPDLYTRQGSAPTTSRYDCRPYYGSGRSETCTHYSAGGKTYYIMVRGYTTASCTLTASY